MLIMSKNKNHDWLILLLFLYNYFAYGKENL